MSVKAEKRATTEQIENLIQEYNTNEKVFDILYTGKTNTLIMLAECYGKGLKITQLTDGYIRVTLPECRNGCYLCNDMYSNKMHISIVRKILTNFAIRNPHYLKLKLNSSRYAISDQFVYDLLMYNKDKGFDHIDISSILPFISNQNIFEQISKTFFIPYEKNETLDHVKKVYWKKNKPFLVKTTNLKSTQEKSFIMYGGSEIESISLENLIKEMKFYQNGKRYHTVAYCTFFPDNLITHFPQCNVYTFQNIYDLFREFKFQKGRKEKLQNDNDSVIFPKHSIVNCENMPTLWGYRKIFEKFVAEDAKRFIIFVNFNSDEAFWGAGGKGHIIFSSK